MILALFIYKPRHNHFNYHSYKGFNTSAKFDHQHKDKSIKMETSRKFFPTIVVLLLLVVTTAAQARECETPSNEFKGICMMVANCANVCLTEGFSGGKCSGFRRRCMCTKDC
ncbi:defensin J1-2 [Oryza sativa Japonica Group]|uniref:Os04g0189400 protein n=7 Tax=Oryza TaxID=4527 RepID=Q0JEX4_ORYSJ|nr:defensin J1-2 [Oryza sativa Japonica Group]KAF2932895.1 hypothetical protein DAI22_04g034800 [Oryza sativa Japonica Group]BAF14113.1 Os04g0189400 [Oryza sativa Japonica Group]BAG92412.1 unnamed protein product [Oryza sativa Japonica Group]BAS88010.1 Os04g0189400 [Oryza sativa Japonica Group]|eukprot:NP_001052199.1 Os04g0189400 [Oryza sativa Japonica Group]